MPVGSNRSGGTGSDAKLAFKARILVERLRVFGDLGLHENGSEQDEVAKFRMNHVAMDAHVTKTRGNATGLWEMSHSFVPQRSASMGKPAAVHGPNSLALERGDDLPRHVIDLVRHVMEFEVRNGSCRRPHVVAVHPANETDERFGFGKQNVDVRFLFGEFFAAYFNKPNLIRTGFETQRAEPCRAEVPQPDGNASGGPLAELPDSLMFIGRSHRILQRERVFPAVPERTIRRDPGRLLSSARICPEQ
jgi:hypothetical protein